MKLIIRMTSVLFILIVTIVTSIYLVNTNIVIDELNRASYNAVLSVQEDLIKLSENKDKTNEEYFYDYADNVKKYFNNYVSNADIYDLRIDGDFQKGIVYLSSRSNFPLVKEKNLLNIIDRTELVTLSLEKDKMPFRTMRWEPRIDQILYTWQFDIPVQIDSWHIDIEARDYNTGAAVKSYRPEMTLTCFNDEEEMIIGKIEDVSNSNGSTSSIFIGKIEEGITCKCDRVELFAKATPYIRMSIMNVGSSRDASLSYYKEKKNVKMYSRFIGDISDLEDDSIWIKNLDYQRVLEEYIKKKNERNNK